jgi:hypothetical protein
MPRFKEIAGQAFGRLTAVRRMGKDRFGKTQWECACKCGVIILVDVSRLIGGNTKSCGCLVGDAFRKKNEQRKADAFGKYHVRARNSWRHMIRRCENPADKFYKDYGGRGIKVCDRWKDLKSFVADMGDPPDGMTLDRWPDKNGNYEPGNCRWATPKQQAQNTRRNVMVSLEGESMCLSEAADRIGITRTTLFSRVAVELKKVEKRIGMPRQLALNFI